MKNVPGNKVASVVFSNTDNFSFARRTSVAEPYTPVSYSLFLSFCSPSVVTLVTVWRLDFLLNSAGKKLRIREGVTRSFPIYLSPGIVAVVQTVHHRRQRSFDLAKFHSISVEFTCDRQTAKFYVRWWSLSYERSRLSFFFFLSLTVFASTEWCFAWFRFTKDKFGRNRLPMFLFVEYGQNFLKFKCKM